MTQTAQEVNEWFSQSDPWNYENTLDDKKRKDILLHTLPKRDYQKTLDIGCGHGFVTRELPGEKVVGVDYAEQAIQQANQFLVSRKELKKRLEYQTADLFELNSHFSQEFDLIIVTGVLYPQYIGKSHTLVYHIIDQLLQPGGILVSVHIHEWYRSRFPYLLLETQMYNYREFTHHLEVYQK